MASAYPSPTDPRAAGRERGPRTSSSAGQLTAGSLDRTGQPEDVLLARLRTGDDELFREIVVGLSPLLTRLARTYTPTDAAAQDAVQDTWLVVVDKLDSFQGRSSLRTWVCGILVHTARRSGVREARTLPFSSAWTDERRPAVDPARFHGRHDAGPTGTWCAPPVHWDEIPEDRLAAKELRSVIDGAIAALPVRQREVITARDVLGLDAAEAAAALGVSSGNQRVLLHRARSKVRAELELYGADTLQEAPVTRQPTSGGGA